LTIKAEHGKIKRYVWWFVFSSRDSPTEIIRAGHSTATYSSFAVVGAKLRTRNREFRQVASDD
jgi:hypothetical protein